MGVTREPLSGVTDDLRRMLHLDDDDRPPELHPDLVPFIQHTDSGTHLRHPLVYQIMYGPHLAGIANEVYEHKLVEIKRARAEKNWDLLIVLYARPWRVHAFIEEVMPWKMRVTDEEYWSLLAWVWTDTENLWQYEDEWRMLLTSYRPGRRRWFMDDDDRRELAALRGPLTIFRGTSAPSGMGAGLSWTLDREVAEKFARRGLDDARRVLEGRVNKNRVVALMNGRSEREVIVFPEHVRDVRTHT